MVRCRRCGTVRLDPRLDDQSLLQLQEQLLLVDAAGTHSFEAGNSNPAYAVMLAALLRRWGMPDRGGRLLDVGCGGGDLLADVAARLEARGAGLELANAAVERARARFPQHAWICGGADQDSFPDGSFEAITLIHVLEHLAEPKHALRRFHRWLAPGGLLVVEVPNGEFYFSRLYTLLFEFPKSLLARVQRMTGRRVPFTVRGFYPYHLTLFGSGSLSRMAESAGYTVLESRPATERLRFWLRENRRERRWARFGINALKLFFARLGWGDNLLVVLRRREPA